jgi:hypothetical protein
MQLIKGGQGRSAKQIEASGLEICWLWLGLALLALAFLSGCCFPPSDTGPFFGTVTMDTGTRFTGIIDYQSDYVRVSRASGPIILDLREVESIEAGSIKRS